MNVKQRAVVLRIAAANFPQNAARTMLEETADVLDALGAAYNDLYSGALLAVKEGRLEKLRIHVERIEKERNNQQISGAA